MEGLVIVVGLVVLAGLLLLLITLIKLTIKLSSERQKHAKARTLELGAIESIIAEHIEGLGIGPNKKCYIFRFEDRILIEADTHKFEIKIQKLRAAVVKNKLQLIQIVQDAGFRSLTGSLVVPGFGGNIGGAAGIGKNSAASGSQLFLIVNYINSNGELAGVIFGTPKYMPALRFCKNIEQSMVRNSNGEVIEL